MWVKFRIHYITSFGESLHLSGSGPLGDWKEPRNLSYSNGEWTLTVTLPVGKEDISYKYFVQNAAGQQWEGGANRVIHSADLQADTYIEIRDQWKVSTASILCCARLTYAQSSASAESTFLDSSLFREVIFHRENTATQKPTPVQHTGTNI